MDQAVEELCNLMKQHLEEYPDRTVDDLAEGGKHRVKWLLWLQIEIAWRMRNTANALQDHLPS